MCRPLHANLTSLSLDVVKLLDSYRGASRELAAEAGEVARNINRVSGCEATSHVRGRAVTTKGGPSEENRGSLTVAVGGCGGGAHQ